MRDEPCISRFVFFFNKFKCCQSKRFFPRGSFWPGGKRRGEGGGEGGRAFSSVLLYFFYPDPNPSPAGSKQKLSIKHCTWRTVQFISRVSSQVHMLSVKRFSESDLELKCLWFFTRLECFIYYIHKSLDNGNGALLLVPSKLVLISAHILCVEKFRKVARFAEPTEAQVIALFEKKTRKHKKAINYRIKILNGTFTKRKKYFK